MQAAARAAAEEQQQRRVGSVRRLGHVRAHVVGQRVSSEFVQSPDSSSQLAVVSLTDSTDDAEDCARLDWVAYAHLRHIWDPDAPVEQPEDSLAESTGHLRESLAKVSKAWGHRRKCDGKLVSCVHFYYAAPARGAAGAGHGRVSGMLVDPEHRGQGLARQLMEVLLAESRGLTISLLSTKMGRQLYASLGFEWLDNYASFFTPREEGLGSAAAAGAWAGVAAADAAALAQAANGTVSVVHSPTKQAIQEVTELDTRMFGGDRSGLLQSSFAKAQGGILVVLRQADGRVTGFGFSAEAGRWGRGLAPLVAETTDGAVAIVAALAALPAVVSSGLRMTLRLEQEVFVERLRGMGFGETAADSPMPGNST